jgi:uncharacterized protein YgiM (DUF1202 family)
MRRLGLPLGLALWTGLTLAPLREALPATATGVTSSTQISSSSTSDAAAQAPPNAVSGSTIVQTALRYLGYRYTTAGASPEAGFSCIGFVSYVYRVNGIPLPDDLALARGYAPAVPFTDLLPGDVLFFQNTIWAGLSHTAIYLGDGRFIHAEWYNRGVVISSFNDDPVDGNYWIGKYLSANRPWSGPAGSVVVPTSSTLSSGTAGSDTSTRYAPKAVVSVPALNLRAGPSRQYQVLQVLGRGTPVSILGYRAAWARIQLSNGTSGWSVSAGLSTRVQTSVPPATAVASVPPNRPRSTVTRVPVIALRLHTAPAITAPVIKVLMHGQSVEVVQLTEEWARVRLRGREQGWISGWVYARFLGIRSAPGSPPPHLLTANVRVHRAPGLRAAVILVARAGTRVDVLGAISAWIHVRLPSRITGYVYRTFVR